MYVPVVRLSWTLSPKRKRKCPECGKAIHAKKLYNEELKYFVTEEEAARIDATNKEHCRQKRIARHIGST